MTITLDEVIAAQFEQTYAGCDPAVDENPRKYSLGWFSEGVFFGIKLGTQIGQDVRTTDARLAWERTWGLGYAQALNYCLFSISHLPIGRDLNVQTVLGGELMRQAVADLLTAAITSEHIRQMAKLGGTSHAEPQDSEIPKKANGKAG